MKANSKAIALGILKATIVMVGILLLCWILYKVKLLIVFLLIAGIVSLICRPLVLFLKNKLKFSNTLASIVTLLKVIGFICIQFSIFIPIIIEQSKSIAEIDFDLVKTDLNELSMQATDYLGLTDDLDIFEAAKRTEFINDFDIELVPSFIEIFFENFSDLIIGIFSVLFISFFFMKDENMVANIVTTFSKKENEKRILLVLYKIRKLLSRYFLGLVLQIVFLTFFYIIILLFFDMNNIVAIAVICAFLNIIPYLGPLLGFVLLNLVILSNNLSVDFSSDLVPLILRLAIGFSIAQILDNLIIQPVVFGKSVKAHPLEIFISIIFGGLLFGIIGMVMAVPTYTAIKVIAKEFLSEYKIVKRLTKNFE
jgi:predicted PurR-regulated permease PerM